MDQGTNLTIDIGNTCTKVLVYEKDVIVWRKTFETLTIKLLRDIYLKFKPLNSILCSVNSTPAPIRAFLQKNTRFIELSGKTKVPVKITYKSPATLGADRLAGIVGASKIFPSKNVLVIDMGTCIKYDFLTSRNKYPGGSISPGLHMRLKALHTFTDRLPLLQPTKIHGLVGKNTNESIQTGVQLGILAEMEAFIADYKKQFGSLKVILCGGDAPRFASQLKMPIFAAPELVSFGLIEILKFNAQK